MNSLEATRELRNIEIVEDFTVDDKDQEVTVAIAGGILVRVGWCAELPSTSTAVAGYTFDCATSEEALVKAYEITRAINRIHR